MIDAAVGEDTDDPRLMRVDGAVYGEIVDLYAESQGRAPTAEEMTRLLDRWVLNETLYREAVGLGLDQGDEMIKERVAQKMRILLRGGVEFETPEDAVLRAYFEENREAYVDPAVMSIEMARIGRGKAAARRWARELNALEESGRPAGPDAPAFYPFYDRPRTAMEQVFGAAFVAEAEALPQGVWTAMRTPDGWHAARLLAAQPRFEATFEQARDAVISDWRAQERRRAEREAVEALMDRYTVRRARYDPEDYRARAAAAAAADGGGDFRRAQ